jgi:hypothetical protein
VIPMLSEIIKLKDAELLSLEISVSRTWPVAFERALLCYHTLSNAIWFYLSKKKFTVRMLNAWFASA